MDYRGLNRVTIANRYLLTLMSELQDRLSGAQFFTKDRLEERPPLSTDQRRRRLENRLPHADMINHIFKDMIDLGLLAYIDDLLIYEETREEHDEIVKEVLQRLRDNKLAVSAEKREWRKAYWNGSLPLPW